MKFYAKLYLYSYLILLLFISSCSKKISEIEWDYSDKDIVGNKLQKSDQIDIDVYVDATTSMEGFAISNTSTYSDFLDQLEASSLSAWKKADLKFFKFGEIIKPIERNEYLSAKTDLRFYRESQIFKKTFIDSVVNKTDANRLSVLITDLFQDEGDVNIMVERLKEKSFAKNIMVGIIGVESGFNGKVYDVPSYPKGYKLETDERPFYAIVFGNSYNMELLFDALKKKDFVKEEQFLLFSPYIIKSFNVSLVKTKDSKFVNKKAPREEVKNSFDFSMKEEGKDARFDLEIDVSRNTRCADFSTENLEVIVFKKSIIDDKNKSPDSLLTKDVSLENLQRNGDKLTATLILKNDNEVGNYSYLVYLKANQLKGLETPNWIKDFSTDNPVPGNESASKTYNLEKLTSTLLVANASVSPTYIAKFYINIFKR